MPSGVERKIGPKTKALYLIHYAGFPGPAAEMRQIARESDQFQEPVTVDVSPDEQVAVIEVPLAGTGTNDESRPR